jgi:hypothetical protein
MSNGFNSIQSEWFNSYVNVNSSKDAKKITNLFKCKYEVLCCYVCFDKCNMQHLNSGFNRSKKDDSTHVKMLIV